MPHDQEPYRVKMPSIRNGQLSRLAAIAVVAAVLTGSRAPMSLAADPRPEKVQLTLEANARVAWLASSEFDETDKKFVIHFASGTSDDVQLKPVEQILPQLGEIHASAIVGEALHVFFGSDATRNPTPSAHYRYSNLGFRRESRLPNHALPVTIAGETQGHQPVLWAVVRARDADAVELAWRENQRRAQPTTTPTEGPGTFGTPGGEVPAPTTQPSDRNPGSYHLVRYDGADWQPAFPLPEDYQPGGHTWLQAAGDTPDLLWQAAPSATELRFARRQGGSWQAGPTLNLPGAPRAGALGTNEQQTLFVAILPDPEEASRGEVHGWAWGPPSEGEPADAWQPLPPAITKGGERLSLPSDSDLATFGDKMIVAKWEAAAEHPRVGVWPTAGGEPVKTFEDVEVRAPGQDQNPRRTVQELVALLVLFSIVLAVLWRRQDSMAFVVPLPVTMEMASFARRGAAAVIDILPAALIVLGIWHSMIAGYISEIDPQGFFKGLELPAVRPEMFWPWLCFRGIYAIYCAGFEWRAGATPGKRMFGCYVLTETLEKPNRNQVLIRNGMRLIELERTLLIWPFFLVLFLTRNRQRIGDLLARTIVVEGEMPTPAQPPSEESSDEE